MLSVVLLPIQRASITPLRTFLQRSLLPSAVNFVSISENHPAISGVFCLLNSASPEAALHQRSSASLGWCIQSAENEGFGEKPFCFVLFRARGLSTFLAAYLFLPMRTMRGFSGQAKAWKGVWIPSWIRLPIGWALALSSFIAWKYHLIVLMSRVSLRR